MSWFKTPEELAAEKLAADMQALESAVDTYIDAELKKRGYKTVDSIGKYLRPTSVFYAECVALGDWVDACWTECFRLQAVGEMLTVDELLAQMPVVPV